MALGKNRSGHTECGSAMKTHVADSILSGGYGAGVGPTVKHRPRNMKCPQILFNVFGVKKYRVFKT